MKDWSVGMKSPVSRFGSNWGEGGTNILNPVMYPGF